MHVKNVFVFGGYVLDEYLFALLLGTEGLARALSA